MPDKKKPFNKLRVGPITLTIWRNRLGNRDLFNFTIERSYVDKEGEWHNTSSFTISDIIRLEVLLRKLEDYMLITLPSVLKDEQTIKPLESLGSNVVTQADLEIPDITFVS